MSARGFTPPEQPGLDVSLPGDGEPDTSTDEFASDDAPEQEYEEEEA